MRIGGGRFDLLVVAIKNLQANNWFDYSDHFVQVDYELTLSIVAVQGNSGLQPDTGKSKGFIKREGNA